MAKSTDGFFDLPRAQSKIKSAIVSKYFRAWSRVMLGEKRLSSPLAQNKNIQYVELFCGPGTYDDGSPSTPIMIMSTAVQDQALSRYLIARFFDYDEVYCRSLEAALSGLDIDRLKYRPEVYCQSVDESLARVFESRRLVPTLLFADPWGYRGLSLRLFESILKDFGSECVFFFNYKRINAAISNPKMRGHIDVLFGPVRGDSLRQKVCTLPPKAREEHVLKALHDAFQEESGRLVLEFRFLTKSGKRTSHFLVFVTKDFRGYDIMREIMAKESTSHVQGVPTFMYDPSAASAPRLFEIEEPLTELKSTLLVDLAGQTLACAAIYEQHSIGRPYIRRNYKDALYSLYEEGRIEVDRIPRRNTFADDIRVSFPISQGDAV